MRLDQYLVTNEYTFSRNKAQEIIKSGYVKVNDKIIKKPSFKIDENDKIEVVQNDGYVSRAAYKLKNYLEKYNITFENKYVLDIGSSTGGFTQVALEAGAKKVVSVDVGSGQLHKTLRDNHKIELYENTDIREFVYNEKFDVIVSDVSFISLLKITDKIDTLAKKDIILLFKPQFEVGREAKRDKKGVVTDMKAVESAMINFENECKKLGWELIRKEESSIKGKEGNTEFIYHFKKV
ncbi:TlyA family rRNA (cytidine-2'-O)-methyltransferase [Nautilia sp. PV-1]|uniref:23S rRNA (cytidine-2'-O)-methyltransferase TlyA n=1 Tax=Nautilia sp. PV-1 TaxID=2579250 RepID=UPI000FD6F6AD|nr:TlyA family RNA methyltransferase [Nautilia sp. PV-1]AZV46759.1 TlyA family rRNA (cytidine-2'-O)-methyltransferase [Nautilia sp. PV-1]